LSPCPLFARSAITVPTSRYRTVIFDVDSTLAAIEGIDWLAGLRDAEVARESEALTARAMAGELPIEAVYSRRLARIRPTATELQELAQAYLAAVVPGMPELIVALHALEVDVHLLSGGLRPTILPLAQHVGVNASHVHAVDLACDSDGTYSLLNGEQPLSTQQGKPTVVAALGLTGPVAMVGDGSTDAMVRDVVDTFIAFTAVARRDQVVALAHAEASSVDALRTLLLD
jgi:phosphoserine phosphatase